MKYVLNSFFWFSISFSVFATPHVSFDGSTTHIIAKTPIRGSGLKTASTKHVTLLKIKLSNDVKKAIQKNASHAMQMQMSTTKTLPSLVQLGMNNVPVLDQGNQGTVLRLHYLERLMHCMDMTIIIVNCAV